MKDSIFRIIILGLLLFVATTRDLSLQFQIGEKEDPSTQATRKVYLTEFTDTEIPINEKQQFINRFANVAKVEMEKYGIPASIKLAQLIHESNWGKSKLFTIGNNGYGIKYLGEGKPFKGCNRSGNDCAKYQTYKTVWEGIRGHSLFLQKSRYQHLKKLGNDWEKWANGLKNAGYATDSRYAEKLIRIIKTYNLNQYDSV